MAAKDILNAMVNAAPGQVDTLDSNIATINDQADGLQEEATAIREGVMDVDSSSLIIYLVNVKIPTSFPGSTLVLGPDYNVINITDWALVDSTALPVYEYLGVGWDGDASIIEWINDWAFGYDYLTRALTSGATYGLNPQIAVLNDASSILTNNRDKIDDVIHLFHVYQ